MKVERKTALSLSVLLIIATIYSYVSIPHSFYVEGGSCYQGITASINILLLKICVALSLVSLILMWYAFKVVISKILSVVSLSIWAMWSLGISLDAKENELLYCMPLLAVNSLIVFMCFKQKKFKKKVIWYKKLCVFATL